MRASSPNWNLRWGYNNVRIKEGDEHKAAFIADGKLWEPTVMFFGMPEFSGHIPINDE